MEEENHRDNEGHNRDEHRNEPQPEQHSSEPHKSFEHHSNEHHSLEPRREPEHHSNEPKEPEHHQPEHHQPEHHQHKPHINNEPDKKNPWIVISIILGIIVIVLLFLMYRGGITGGVIGVGSNTISGEDASNKIIGYLNERTGGGVEFVSTDDIGNLYKINVKFQGQEIPVFITKDGEYFVQGAIKIDVLLNESTNTQGSETQKPSTSEAIEVSADDDAVKGNPNAPVTIVEFSDYECPFCGKYFQETYPQLIKEYVDTGKVKIVFRDFPLGFHKKAQKAAEAAECAGEQGKYWEMHDKLFENQKALEIDNLKQYANEIGLNPNEFDTCLDSGQMEDEVKADIDEGSSYGVTGTPAFFINGRMLSGAQPFGAFREIIEEELNNQGG